MDDSSLFQLKRKSSIGKTLITKSSYYTGIKCFYIVGTLFEGEGDIILFEGFSCSIVYFYRPSELCLFLYVSASVNVPVRPYICLCLCQDISICLQHFGVSSVSPDGAYRAPAAPVNACLYTKLFIFFSFLF